jgi:hypothetical protein
MKVLKEHVAELDFTGCLEGGVALDGAAAAGRPSGLQVGLPGGAPERAAPATAPPLVRRDGLVARLAVQVRARLLAVLHPTHQHQEKAHENRLFSDDNSKFERCKGQEIFSGQLGKI